MGGSNLGDNAGSVLSDNQHDRAYSCGQNLPAGDQVNRANPVLGHRDAQQLVLPGAGQIGINAGQPALGIIQAVPCFIYINPRIGVCGPRGPRPMRKGCTAVVVSDGVLNLDHLGQHNGIVFPRCQRHIGRHMVAMGIFRFKSRHRNRPLAVLVKACAPPQLAGMGMGTGKYEELFLKKLLIWLLINLFLSINF